MQNNANANANANTPAREALGPALELERERYGVHYLGDEGDALVMGFYEDELAKAYAFAEFVGGEVIDWA